MNSRLMTRIGVALIIGLGAITAQAGLPLPAYDQVVKASHAFNLLEARGAISATERAAYIGRVRNLAREVAQVYLELEADGAAAA